MNINLKAHKSDLLFTALGGAGEIGMNVNLYHLDGKWLMVDLGLGFADGVPGVDMLAPDISFIKSHKKNLVGLILTHIHEDHLGAVQYLWEELEVPIYTSNLTAKFLRSKLSEYNFLNRVKIITINPQVALDLDPFKIEFIGLTHSVPEMNALIIKTRHGNVLHSGDWKFDPDPVVGNVSEIGKIKAYGDKGEILALVCDSTNAMSPGRSRSEGELLDSLKSIIANSKQMVGVTTFASNIARIHTISKVAESVGRKVVLSGYSLRRLVEVGTKAGYFSDLPAFISDQEIKFYKRNEILILSTGCQGEPMASTMKIAKNTHPNIKFIPGDLMIFSSKIIPGNEKSIYELFNLFAKRKIEIITEKDHFVHVSGHPSQDELKEMYELAKPNIAIPVHGEFVHIKEHCKLASENGVKQVVPVENGSVVKLCKNSSEIVGFVQTGYFGVDGKQLLPLEGDVIKARYKLQNSGIVIAAIVIDENGSLIGDPHIAAPGCYDFKSDTDSLELMKREIAKAVRNSAQNMGLLDGIKKKIFGKKKKKKNISEDKITAGIEKQIRTIITKNFAELTGKKPWIEVVVRVV